MFFFLKITFFSKALTPWTIIQGIEDKEVDDKGLETLPIKSETERQGCRFNHNVKEDNIVSITINSNVAASHSALNMKRANNLLTKSLQRLSSGKRIVSPSDDAGGLAVGMKLQSSFAEPQHPE